MPSIAPIDSGDGSFGQAEFAGFLKTVPTFGFAEGTVHLLGENPLRLQVHDGMLASYHCLSTNKLLTSGEDGKVCAVSGDGAIELLSEMPGKWIDRLAAGPNGAVGFSAGRMATVLIDGQKRQIECERTIEGLAFAPKGMRLAFARYNGVDLNWVNTGNAPQFLEWKGAHTDVVFSPDGKYVVSAMQENALHGWRITDNKHMQMTGYPAKVKSMSWSVKGKWLASSGAPAAIVWPFSGKDGPMGKAPLELGAMGNMLVSHVAFHPQEEVLAIGYGDGSVMAVRLEDNKEALLKRSGSGAISTMNWDQGGKLLAYGTEAGEAGIIDING